MYAAFDDVPDLRPYTHVTPRIDIHELNTPMAWGAQRSLQLDFSDFDLVPTLELSENHLEEPQGRRFTDARPDEAIPPGEPREPATLTVVARRRGARRLRTRVAQVTRACRRGTLMEVR